MVDTFRAEQKTGGFDPEVSEARFVYGMVLLGLGLLHKEAQDKRGSAHEHEGTPFERSAEPINIEDRVEEFTKGVAPVLLPMIDHLGSLDLDGSTSTVISGETT
jgi:hypothetical protein